MIVKDLQNRQDLIFVSDNQDIKFIKDFISETKKDYDSFFVKIENGDYTEIYGIYGIIPYLSKKVYQII